MIRAHNLVARIENFLEAKGIDYRVYDDFKVQDDLDALPPKLIYWNTEKLGAQPTQEEIDAAAVTRPIIDLSDPEQQEKVTKTILLLIQQYTNKTKLQVWQDFKTIYNNLP